ncbi:hypothetical protein JCM14469_09060 [Desulfatiferula olefinivorans]
MTDGTSVSLEDLLNHEDVRDIIGDVSQETRERRAFVPPICDVFYTPYTILRDDDRYRFEIDQETRRQLPHIIGNKVQSVIGVESGEGVSLEAVKENISRARTIGIVFSGGPAPGGHNVIAGLYDAAKKANPANTILGFYMGPDGIIEGNTVPITRELVDRYRNLGGFSMIKTGRTKIDTAEKMSLSRETCKKLGLDAIVVVGGDDSNTNAAFMAQEFYNDGIQVIGVPKTIDGDIQVKDASGQVICAMSFGFHTAARSFAKNISDLCTDGSSDVKYWHVCKVMGRVASHLALEVALQTHANLTLIGEDLADYIDVKRMKKAEEAGTVDYTAYGMTLRHLSRVICKAIMKRAAVGKNYGVIVIPEGLLEFIDEVQLFIIKLNTIIADYNEDHDRDFHSTFPLLEDKLEYLRRLVRGIRKDGPTIWNARDDELFNDIPSFFQEGLLMERDSHGNFQFSQVQTEKILVQMVEDYLEILKEKGRYKMGISHEYFRETMVRAGLDPDVIGPSIFRNYNGEPFCLVKEDIFTHKTLKKALVRDNIIGEDDKVPAAVLKIYNKSVPKLKVQSHFYGYDGRGADPTRFDCKYTYNLGMTVFSLVANGATGQMAAIRNLEKDFSKWEPIGIPIAPLMHLEERGGKMTLVLEKSLVDLNSNAFRVVKALRDTWLAATPVEDHFRKPGPLRFTGASEEDRPMTLVLNAIRG